jgi:hypothetical protein
LVFSKRENQTSADHIDRRALGVGQIIFHASIGGGSQKAKTNAYKCYFIKFNAWRSDKDEALWAAFALTFIKQLKIPLSQRLLANIKLLWKRLDWKRGWFRLVQIATSWIAFLSLGIYLTIHGLKHPEIFKNPDTITILFGIPLLAAAYFGFDKAKTIFGDPLSYDLSKYVPKSQIRRQGRIHRSFSG